MYDTNYRVHWNNSLNVVLLICISNSLCLPLFILFKKSFNNSYLPDDWEFKINLLNTSVEGRRMHV